jgi:hypothetical protein
MEGRFISKDPIGFGGGINIYAYTRNNPINRKDPLGLCDKCPGGKWLGAAFRTFNFKCACKWLCVPPGNEIWSGSHTINMAVLPSTGGTVINTGPEPESGDSCLCSDPDGYGHSLPLGLEEHR